MKFIHGFRALLGAFVCAGFLTQGIAQQHAAGLGVPALKVIAPNGRESILLGDLHVGVPGQRQPDISVFDRARVFVVEHPGGFSAPVNPFAGTEEAPWARSLTEPERTAYFSRAKCLGPLGKATAALALMRRSAQVANQIAYTVCSQDGVVSSSRNKVLDTYLPQLRLRRGYLEEADWVETQRHRVPGDVSEAALHWVLQRDPKAVLSDVVQALNAGDYDRIAAAALASMGGAERAGEFIDVMINQRNQHWMPGLRRFLDEGGAVILVGAGHLPGPNGLIELLRSDGYVVQPFLLSQATK